MNVIDCLFAEERSISKNYLIGPAFQRLGSLATQSRLNVVDEPPDPCIAQLSFADKNGNAVGQTLNVNLSSGQAKFLDDLGSAFFS
jgi:hypothetical protein